MRERHCGTAAPRLFVHRLPESYRDPQDTIGRGVGAPLFNGSARRALGSAFPHGVTLWDSQQYNLGELFYERAIAYGCRTHDPSRADLFFVPAFSGRASTSVLEARGGADHVLLTARTGQAAERRPFAELDYGDGRLGSATLLAHEEFGARHRPLLPQWPGEPPAEGVFRSVPWSSLVHIDAASKPQGVPWAHQPERTRSPLVAAVFTSDHGARLSVAIRKALRKSCAAREKAVCTFLLPEPPGAGIGAQRFEEIASLFWRSTFCLQPPGDTVSRKGLVDSLLLGCIPVLFHEGQAAQWPWHWGDWQRNATVLLDGAAVGEGRLDAIAHLQRLPEAEVRRLRGVIGANAHTLMYSAVDSQLLPPGLLPPGAADAFDIALEGAWRAARTPGAVGRGMRLQQLADWAAGAALGGNCAETDFGDGECPHARRGRGAWHMRTGSLAACALACEGCADCRFVSYSREKEDCSWFKQCDPQALLASEGDFRTLAMAGAPPKEGRRIRMPRVT